MIPTSFMSFDFFALSVALMTVHSVLSEVRLLEKLQKLIFFLRYSTSYAGNYPRVKCEVSPKIFNNVKGEHLEKLGCDKTRFHKSVKDVVKIPDFLVFWVFF